MHFLPSYNINSIMTIPGYMHVVPMYGVKSHEIWFYVDWTN